MRRLSLVVLGLSTSVACSGRTETIIVVAGGSGGAAGAAGSGGGGTGGGAGDAGLPVFCPSGPGPEMVAIETPTGWYCIDSTEVTEHDYADFLDTSPPPQTGTCSWNTTYEELTSTPRSLYPRRWVDWCDARAYCEWAGKRLCGAIGGGTAPYDKFASAASSEWYFACSRGGQQSYPYGKTFEEWPCMTAEYPMPTKKVWMAGWGGCEGGYAGLHDMSGNVREWEDSCKTDAEGPGVSCRLRGGGVGSSQEFTRCQSDDHMGRSNTDDDVGFRCCADATALE